MQLGAARFCVLQPTSCRKSQMNENECRFYGSSTATRTWSLTLFSCMPPSFHIRIAFQTFISSMLGWFVFRIIVVPQKKRDGKGPTMLSTLFACGIAIPFVIVEPICLIWYVDIRHIGLRMTRSLMNSSSAHSQSSISKLSHWHIFLRAISDSILWFHPLWMQKEFA